MCETTKFCQIATEMRRNKLAVLAISETHWTQAGQQKLDTGKMLPYSGYEDENAPQNQGNSLMLSKEARNAHKRRESHRSRITKASFKTKKEVFTINVTQCYAPTNDNNNDEKDTFYEGLESFIVK
ncbi:unnamed protein product [Schistosoma rodhaini]|nr:unnamed protein product [Schistosoma rodhaini]